MGAWSRQLNSEVVKATTINFKIDQKINKQIIENAGVEMIDDEEDGLEMTRWKVWGTGRDCIAFFTFVEDGV